MGTSPKDQLIAALIPKTKPEEGKNYHNISDYYIAVYQRLTEDTNNNEPEIGAFSIITKGYYGTFYGSIDRKMCGPFTGEDIKTRTFYKDGNRFITNCVLTSLDKFDSVRLLLRSRGLIEDYCIGYATDQEIEKVLSIIKNCHKMGANFLTGNANPQLNNKRRR